MRLTNDVTSVRCCLTSFRKKNQLYTTELNWSEQTKFSTFYVDALKLQIEYDIISQKFDVTAKQKKV